MAGKANGNFARIDRDTRFSKDKSPYKSNFYLYAYDRRQDRGRTGRLYVGLSADCLSVGFSIYGSWKGPKGALETLFQKRVASHREIFENLLARVVRARRYETYWHRQERGDSAQPPACRAARRIGKHSTPGWCRKIFLPNARGLGTAAFAGAVERVSRPVFRWSFSPRRRPPNGRRRSTRR